MSRFEIQKYYNEIQEIIDYGGSKKESAIRTAFQKLLDTYAMAKGLKVIAELTIKTPKDDNVSPDGTLKDSLRLDWGYWEAKDTYDDLDKEIENKIAKNYPTDNILCNSYCEVV